MSRTPIPTEPASALEALRERTPARIALGRRGVGLPTGAVLAFSQAHALARDAVHAELDVAALKRELTDRGLDSTRVASQAPDRAAYLARPDWGRRLADDVVLHGPAATVPVFDLVVVVSDGLSATAAQRHAVPVVTGLMERLADLNIAPVVIATQARVALADEVGERLGARLALSLIGERPGLSAPDSLGAYLTWAPRRGCTDAQRYCVSNIRPEGLDYPEAVEALTRLVRRSLDEQRTGVDTQATAP
ncbi:ethanolamine ammonia-lyase subunit EutC [uncultured Abyssibacter sp.]|uniref:ethanolamine ammonia-lyase subunit EutC n=1 Tax=uncultured Abyssibacter sp. TaxID=2320202 RepID=UPI0032B15DAD